MQKSKKQIIQMCTFTHCGHIGHRSLKRLSKIVADDIQIYLLLFRENKTRTFIRINSHTMSSIVFAEK